MHLHSGTLRARFRCARTVRGGLLALLVALAAAGCARLPSVHVPPVQQGNVVEQGALDKLKPGMTRSQVRFLLGTPLVVDVFRQDRWDYVFMLKRRGEPLQQRRVTVVFNGDELARIEGDVVAASPPAGGSPGAAASVPAASAQPRADAKADPKADAKVDAKADAKADAAAAPERGFFGRMFQRIGF